MPEFCDVSAPVPLDMVFTYRVPADATPIVGGRVLVPFRQQRMMGIVVELHDRKPSVTTKTVLAVLDAAPVLDGQLLQLGRWIADYYLAPLGEVISRDIFLKTTCRTAPPSCAKRHCVPPRVSPKRFSPEWFARNGSPAKMSPLLKTQPAR